MRDFLLRGDEQEVYHSVINFLGLTDSANPAEESLLLDVLDDRWSQFIHCRECPAQQFVRFS
jgi:hypothetical protein